MRKTRKSLTRDRRFVFRVTEAELDVIKNDAKGAKMSVSEYIRRILSGRMPKLRFEIPVNDPEIIRIFANLDTISKDLNLIAAQLNSGAKWNQELHSRVKDDLKEINRIRDEFREYSQGETLREKVLVELDKLNLNDHRS